MYSNVDDVRNALTPGAVSNDKTTAGSLTEAQVNDAIAEADATIDLHIRVTVPDPIPAIVRAWSRDLAAWLCHLTYNRSRPIDENDPVRLRRNATILQLEAVRDGVASLPFTPGGGGVGAGEPLVINQYSGNLFHPADFKLTHSWEHRPADTWPGRYA